MEDGLHDARREYDTNVERWDEDHPPLDLSHLPPCPGIPYTDEEVAASIARARADVAAGRVHSNAIVGEWLLTWGKPGRKPFKEWLADRHG